MPSAAPPATGDADGAPESSGRTGARRSPGAAAARRRRPAPARPHRADRAASPARRPRRGPRASRARSSRASISSASLPASAARFASSSRMRGSSQDSRRPRGSDATRVAASPMRAYRGSLVKPVSMISTRKSLLRDAPLVVALGIGPTPFRRTEARSALESRSEPPPRRAGCRRSRWAGESAPTPRARPPARSGRTSPPPGRSG